MSLVKLNIKSVSYISSLYEYDNYSNEKLLLCGYLKKNEPKKNIFRTLIKVKLGSNSSMTKTHLAIHINGIRNDNSHDNTIIIIKAFCENLDLNTITWSNQPEQYCQNAMRVDLARDDIGKYKYIDISKLIKNNNPLSETIIICLDTYEGVSENKLISIDSIDSSFPPYIEFDDSSGLNEDVSDFLSSNNLRNTRVIYIPGIPGEPGQKGPQGNPGPIGAMGIAGPQGPAGKRGPTGPAGPMAKIELNENITIIDVNDIIGPTGPTGPAGPAGETGITGPKGEDGIRGEKGNIGPKGETGYTGPTGIVIPDSNSKSIITLQNRRGYTVVMNTTNTDGIDSLPISVKFLTARVYGSAFSSVFSEENYTDINIHEPGIYQAFFTINQESGNTIERDGYAYLNLEYLDENNTVKNSEIRGSRVTLYDNEFASVDLGLTSTSISIFSIKNEKLLDAANNIYVKLSIKLCQATAFSVPKKEFTILEAVVTIIKMITLE